MPAIFKPESTPNLEMIGSRLIDCRDDVRELGNVILLP